MTNKTNSWSEETGEGFLDDSDDTDDAGHGQEDPVELRESESSDGDVSEHATTPPPPGTSANTLRICRSRSRSPQTAHSSYYLGRDKRTKWFKEAPARGRARRRGRRDDVVVVLPGVKPVGRDANSVSECWSLFFADRTVDDIVKHTNAHLDRIRPNYTRPRVVRETSRAEVRALFGLLYLAGVLRGNHLNLDDLWSDDGLSPEYFRAVMSKTRFYMLLRALRFDDTGTRARRKRLDRLAAVRTVFDDFVARCENCYTPGRNVTVDEMLEGFRGRCSFRQCVPGKRNKYGIKIRALVDSRTFYTCKMEVCVGAQPDGPYKRENSPASVVKRLIAAVAKTGRNVTVDHRYNSVPLAIDLLENHDTTVVGTLRKNDREIPRCFLDTRHRQSNSTMFGYGKDVLLASYVPKKNKNVVLLVSTMHGRRGVVDPESGVKKPEVIAHYDGTKRGVDEIKSEYSVSRISCRWPLTVFFSLMNVGGVNSQIVFRENGGIHMSRREFLRTLGKELTKPFMLERLRLPTLRTCIRQRIIKLTGYTKTENEAPPEHSNIGNRPKCTFCAKRKNRKTTTKCVICSVPICKEHTMSTCVPCRVDKNGANTSESE